MEDMISHPEAAMEGAMKVEEVILRAIARKITWWQAAEIIGISDRQMRRGEKTRQLVKGEVVTQTTGSLLFHYFYIAAPTLNYRFELFNISHSVNFYPLVMRYLNNTTSLASENAFKEKLKEILASQHTLNVVHSIIAQVRA